MSPFYDNQYLRGLRDLSMSDALAGQTGARQAAMVSAGDDPSVAASSSLQAMLHGQSNASRTLGMGRLQWQKSQLDLKNQRELMKYQQELMKQAQGNPLAGALGGIGGAALGSWLGPGGWFAGSGG
jgi:hypothetical protein